ncbi:ABC transporter permease [Saccharopolyspora spinosa]|nr:hypothetical protein [Saccharopolyspora spinosa]
MLVLAPGLLSLAGTFSFLEGFSLLGLVALGLGVTVIAGELDLSAGSMAALAAVLAVHVAPLGLVPTLLLVTFFGFVAGAMQGWLIGRLAINSLVFTLATLIGFGGLAWVVSGNRAIVLKDLSVTDPLLSSIGVFSPSSLLALIAFVVVGIVLAFARVGREIYAIGGARAEAIAAGVDAPRALSVSFAVSGACAALAGSLAALRSGSASPDSFATILIAAVIAVLIGGVGLSGGRGTVVNIAIGVFVASVVSAAMFARGEATSVAELVMGVVLVLILAAEYFASRWGRKRAQKALRRSRNSPAMTTA